MFELLQHNGTMLREGPASLHQADCLSIPHACRQGLFKEYIKRQDNLEQQLKRVEPTAWQLVGKGWVQVVLRQNVSKAARPVGASSSWALTQQLVGSMSLEICILLLHLIVLQIDDQIRGGGMQLEELCLSSPELKELPAFIGQLGSLLMFKLSGCSHLEHLSPSIGKLTSLLMLDLSGCGQLEQLPPSFGQLVCLRTLDLSGCSRLEQLPPSFGQLSSLCMLNLLGCSQLKQLPSNIWQLSNLCTLDLSGCSRLEQLPSRVGELSNLRTLDLSGCSQLKQLSCSIGQLVCLQNLHLSRCSRLKYLPSSIEELSNLGVLNLSGCSQLKHLPDEIGQLISLDTLNVAGCSQLKRLPSSIGQLGSLEMLVLSGCSQLKHLPDELGQLRLLRTLDVSGCSKIEQLPNLSSCSRLFALKNTDALCPLSMPYNFLPRQLQRLLPQFVVDQDQALQQSMGAISWIAILLAAASFVGFNSVPGSTNDTGLVRVADTGMNLASLKSYFICNVCTFFFAFTTALFSVTHSMPQASELVAEDVLSTILWSSLLLVLTMCAGTATFVSAVFAVYPRSQYASMLITTAVAGLILLAVGFRGHFSRVSLLGSQLSPKRWYERLLLWLFRSFSLLWLPAFVHIVVAKVRKQEPPPRAHNAPKPQFGPHIDVTSPDPSQELKDILAELVGLRHSLACFQPPTKESTRKSGGPKAPPPVAPAAAAAAVNS